MSKKILIPLISIGLILIIIVTSIISLSNSLVTQEQDIESQFAQIENQYQRRYDLIPNLVNSVQGVMDQEDEIFLEISKSRTNYANASTDEEKAKYGEEMGAGLSRLIAITESYPELKSSDNVQTLMTQIEGTENRISTERRKYNDNIKDYNTTLKTFPNSMFAGILGHSEKEYLEALPEAQNSPEVNFE